MKFRKYMMLIGIYYLDKIKAPKAECHEDGECYSGVPLSNNIFKTTVGGNDYELS